MNEGRRIWLGAGLIAVAGWRSANAQSYPTKPVTVIVPQAPGGTNDVVARILAQRLGEASKQSFVVENRPGAGGNIGTENVARGAKDGYTLLVTISSSQAINPALYRKINFDPVKDFAPIAPIGTVPNVLVVNPGFPAKDLAEFAKVVKAAKPEYQYASAGNGTLNHLLGAMLTSMGGLPLQHVPYRGVAPALTDVIGGQVPMAFASLPSCLEFIRAGSLRAIGVSSRTRAAALPNVPSISELVPGYEGDLWVGLFAREGTPDSVLARLGELTQAVMASADVKAQLEKAGVEPLIGGAQRLAEMVKTDLARWAPIVKASGVTID